MRSEKSSRWAAMLVATIVAILTCMTVANATQTITTPNAVKITYNLAAGANSAVITPVTNTSVLVMGCCTTLNHQALGQVSLLHVQSVGMTWEGLESSSTINGSSITQSHGVISGPATHIVYIDSDHFVDIRVDSANTILVHNASAGTNAGNVTLIW
jgi:hypothetical protein